MQAQVPAVPRLKPLCNIPWLDFLSQQQRIVLPCRRNFPPFRFDSLLALPINLILRSTFATKLDGNFVPLPPIAKYDTMDLWAKDVAQGAPWADDGIFAEQRLSGNNPIQIRRLAAGDVRAGVLQAAADAGTVKLPSLQEDLKAGAR